VATPIIIDAEQANTIVAEGRADLVALARGFFDDPHWGWHAASRLGVAPKLLPQDQRAGLKAWAPAERYATKAA
jgi:2,4-dienoyl-CoA reductase-like NADH-dependent reductase (Old Yellow Enzyme family)